MEDKELIQALHGLQQSVRPSDRLEKRITFLSEHLPAHKRGSLLSSLMPHPAVVFAVLLLIVVLGGSGTMLSATQSKPGSFLFPVKKAVVQTQIHFTSNPITRQKLQQEILLATPTPTPTPTVRPIPTSQKSREEKDVRGAETKSIYVTPTPTPTKRRGNAFWPNKTQFEQNFSDHGQNSGSLFLYNHEF